MNARLASRAGRLRRRTSVRRLGEGAEGTELHTDSGGTLEAGHANALPAKAKAAGAARAGHNVAPVPASPGTLLAFARETYNVRRRRARFLPADLFGEPTWDILLDLYVATCENRSVPTTSACIGAHVPPTTALRWLRILEARGLVEREEDDHDGRRTFVRLSELGLKAMQDWLRAALATLDQTIGSASRLADGVQLPMAEAAE